MKPARNNTSKLFHAVVVLGIGLVSAEAACSSSSSTPTSSSSSGSTGGTSGTSGASGTGGDAGGNDAMAGWMCCG